MTLCDTDIVIEYLKNNESICKLIESIGFDNISISIITKAELLHGAFDKNESLKIEKYLSTLEIYHIDNNISLKFNDIMKDYSLSHRINIPDALIAATAIINNIELLTRNKKDFKFIKGIKLYK